MMTPKRAGEDVGAALRDALRSGELDEALQWLARREEALRGLTPNCLDALEVARKIDREIRAEAEALRSRLREEIQSLRVLRNRVAKRPRARRSAHFINKRA